MTNETIISRYRCALCWGGLKEIFDEKKGWIVVCAADASHEGHVTATFVESERHRSVLEAAEVKYHYSDLLGLKDDKTAGSQALYGSE